MGGTTFVSVMSQTTFKKMADFQKAYRITASWEGKFSKVPERGSMEEESAYGEWWGTNFGLTGSFMRDFAGWKKPQKAAFQKMNVQQTGEVWRKTRWAWAKLDKVNDQEIANLLFDWGVRRWNSLIKGVASVLNVPVTNITQKVRMIDMGGNPLSKTDGFYILTDYAIQLINRHPNPQLLHGLLKAKRMALDKPSADSLKARYQSFSYIGTESKDVLLANSDSKKRGLVIQKKPRQMTERDIIFLEIGGLFLGGKLLRLW